MARIKVLEESILNTDLAEIEMMKVDTMWTPQFPRSKYRKRFKLTGCLFV